MASPAQGTPARPRERGLTNGFGMNVRYASAEPAFICNSGKEPSVSTLGLSGLPVVSPVQLSSGVYTARHILKRLFGNVEEKHTAVIGAKRQG